MREHNVDGVKGSDTGMLFLHALPLDGSMWAGYLDLLPGSTYAPTLYGFGNTIEEWAAGALDVANNDRLIVVGCSVGGSCALEIAMTAPNRVAALVLIGTKAGHRPDPTFHVSALEFIENAGLSEAWDKYWAPLFSSSSSQKTVEAARKLALDQSARDIACGVSVFHTRPSRDSFVAKCQIPVVVVSGENDIAPGLAASSKLAAAAPQGHMHIIPSCGHYVPLEQPQALNSILKDAIKTQF